VGTGAGDLECVTETVPGRININTPKVGIEMECSYAAIFDKYTSEYLVTSPRLLWVNGTSMSMPTNAIAFHNPTGSVLMIGRKNFGTYTAVSKVHLGDSFYFMLNGKQMAYKSEFEILTCDLN
jgi:hypothetical protein